MTEQNPKPKKRKWTLTEIMQRPMPIATPEQKRELDILEELLAPENQNRNTDQ